MPPSHIIIAPQFVDKEDRQSLEHILKGNNLKAKLLEKAEGSGTDLLNLLEERSSKAKFKANCHLGRVHAARLQRHHRRAHHDLYAFMKTYDDMKACLPRNISDEEEVEMINTIAFKSPEVRTNLTL